MSKAKILVVEDELISAKGIRSALKSLGYDVLDIVASGKEAIQKASGSQPDLILMDIKLDGEMDGIEAARQIKDRFNIPVVYLTAHADDATLERAKITDPFGYILKPFE
ncbi:response regulator, partial [candidate division WWE3 bacterium]|nr:response regulator [candidate division WWE3 bacterium]